MVISAIYSHLAQSRFKMRLYLPIDFMMREISKNFIKKDDAMSKITVFCFKVCLEPKVIQER